MGGWGTQIKKSKIQWGVVHAQHSGSEIDINIDVEGLCIYLRLSERSRFTAIWNHLTDLKVEHPLPVGAKLCAKFTFYALFFKNNLLQREIMDDF